MALGIDTTRAFRFHDEIVYLVEAVIAAGEMDESTWIEWKRSLNLTEEAPFQHLPLQILGFANREPASAALHAEGYAYLIIGAEPGNVPGIAPIDPGDLSSRLRAYIGERITWHADYVTVQGKAVLVITVDPPRPGDPFHPLLKQLRNMTPGDLPIRLTGQSVKAQPAHIAMLEKRTKASANVVDISVTRWGAPEIQRAPELAPLTTPRTQEMRQRLLDGASAHSAVWVSESVGSVSLTDLLGSDMNIDIERYAQDVELYLNQWTRAVRARRDMLFADHAPSHLTLTVRNNTDRNYLAVQVNVFIPGIRSLDHDDRRWPSLPAEPAPPLLTRDGPVALFEMFGSNGMPRGSGPVVPYVLDAELEMVHVAPEKKLRKTQGPAGVLLAYPEFDLRPRQELVLQSVCLDVYDASAASVCVQ